MERSGEVTVIKGLSSKEGAWMEPGVQDSKEGGGGSKNMSNPWVSCWGSCWGSCLDGISYFDTLISQSQRNKVSQVRIGNYGQTRFVFIRHSDMKFQRLWFSRELQKGFQETDILLKKTSTTFPIRFSFQINRNKWFVLSLAFNLHT